MKQILVVFGLQLLCISVFAATKWPKPDFSNCDFYSKAEKATQCSLNGSDYLVGYGEFYCKRFKAESLHWSGKLKTWVEKTGSCLQEMLYDNQEKRLKPCSALEEFAFDAHPICYKQYGICDLSIEDYWRLKDLVRTIDMTNVMKNFRRSKTQFNNVFEACKERFAQRVEDTFFNLLFENAYRASKNIKEMSGEVFNRAPKSQPQRDKYYRSALAILLFGNANQNSDQATALFEQQTLAQSPEFAVGSAKVADKCFASLKLGRRDSICGTKVRAQAQSDIRIQAALKDYKPMVTEQRLKAILELRAEPK